MFSKSYFLWCQVQFLADVSIADVSNVHGCTNSNSDDDEPIPSTQPHAEHPPANVPNDDTQVPPPPPADDDRDDGPHDTCDDSLLWDENLVKLNEFRSKWMEVFNLDHLWEDFCNYCKQFATKCLNIAQYLNKLKEGKPQLAVVPPPCCPPNGCPFCRFNLVQAGQTQGLYLHPKKRASRKLLNDMFFSYYGLMANAKEYFDSVLSGKQCNTNLLCETLHAHVPNAVDEKTTKSLKDAILESKVAAKLRSASNTALGADRIENAHLEKIDPIGKILTLTFNTYLGAKNVPPI